METLRFSRVCTLGMALLAASTLSFNALAVNGETTTTSTSTSTDDDNGDTTERSDPDRYCVFFDKIHFTLSGSIRSYRQNTHYDVKVFDRFNEVADLRAKVLDKLCRSAGSGQQSFQSCYNDNNYRRIRIEDVDFAADCREGQIGSIPGQ